MSVIERPPHIDEQALRLALIDKFEDEDARLIDSLNNEFAYWDKVKYARRPAGWTAQKLWTYVKAKRLPATINVWPKYNIGLCVTNSMLRACYELDVNLSRGWKEPWQMGKSEQKTYLVSSLMEEAIFSSQMEGAATTRKVAKEMLSGRIKPKDKSQQMIANNYQTIQFVAEHKRTALTKALLQQVHRLMTDKTLVHADDAGRLRTSDEVVVENGIAHEVVHRPPSHTEIDAFVDDLCRYFNEDDREVFVHPIIKGIVIHFMVAYMHPFVDGNGRTARALFYWYLLKQGYGLMEYMSISRVIAKSKKAYEKSFLQTEADGNDTGYFVTYNLRVLQQAYRQLQDYLRRKHDEKQSALTYMQLGDLNERQAQIVKTFVDNPDETLTINALQRRFHITPTTAKTDLIGLMSRGLVEEFALNKIKRGYKKGSSLDKEIEGLTK